MTTKEIIPSNRTFEEDLNLPFYNENFNEEPSNVFANRYVKLQLENASLKLKIETLKKRYKTILEEQLKHFQTAIKGL